VFLGNYFRYIRVWWTFLNLDSLFFGRCNTSLLIDYCSKEEDGRHKYILIDVGKSFREQVLRWFTFYKIPRVDSVKPFIYLSSWSLASIFFSEMKSNFYWLMLVWFCVDHSNSWARRCGSWLRWNSISSTSWCNYCWYRSTSRLSISIYNGEVPSSISVLYLNSGLKLFKLAFDETFKATKNCAVLLQGFLIWLKRR